MGILFASNQCFAVSKTNAILKFIFPIIVFTNQTSYADGKIKGYKSDYDIVKERDLRKLRKKKGKSKSDKSPSASPSSLPTKAPTLEPISYNPLEYDIMCYSGNQPLECGTLKHPEQDIDGDCNIFIAYFCYVKNETEDDYLVVEEMIERRDEKSWNLLEMVEDQDRIVLYPDGGYPFIDIQEFDRCQAKCYQNSLSAKVKFLRRNSDHSLEEKIDFCVE